MKLSLPSLPHSIQEQKRREKGLSLSHTHRLRRREMVMWVFGYGSLIWKAGFNYDERVVGFIKGYRRVFYQGSTDHRGTPAFPGRTVTLEPAPDEVCWGVAYKVSRKNDEMIALTYLEVREKQYDQKAYADLFTDPSSSTPAVCGVMVYVASPDTTANNNYLGPAPIEEMAKQIIQAEGPSGPNRDYLFHLEEALRELGVFSLQERSAFYMLTLDFRLLFRFSILLCAGCQDLHVRDLSDAVRKLISEKNM